MIGELLERNKNEENKKYSIIHWHTGEPKESGCYLSLPLRFISISLSRSMYIEIV